MNMKKILSWNRYNDNHDVSPHRLELPIMRRPDILNAEEGYTLVPIEHSDDSTLPGDILLHHTLPGARAGQVRSDLNLNKHNTTMTL